MPLFIWSDPRLTCQVYWKMLYQSLNNVFKVWTLHSYIYSQSHLSGASELTHCGLVTSGTTLAQVMACCLTAPSHYLNRCWQSMKSSDINSGAISQEMPQPSITKINLKIIIFIKNVVAVAAYSRLASRSQAKFHTMKLSPLVRPCAAAPAQSTTSAYRSLRFSPR